MCQYSWILGLLVKIIFIQSINLLTVFLVNGLIIKSLKLKDKENFADKLFMIFNMKSHLMLEESQFDI